MKKILFSTLVLVVAGHNVEAATTAHSMVVSVEVVARTILNVESFPATVEVSSADIARGFVNLSDPVIFSVKSNARHGYRIQFEPIRGPFSGALLTWENAIVNVGVDGSWIFRPFHKEMRTTAMAVRLIVPPGMRPGTYQFPIAFDVQ